MSQNLVKKPKKIETFDDEDDDDIDETPSTSSSDDAKKKMFKMMAIILWSNGRISIYNIYLFITITKRIYILGFRKYNERSCCRIFWCS